MLLGLNKEGLKLCCDSICGQGATRRAGVRGSERGAFCCYFQRRCTCVSDYECATSCVSVSDYEGTGCGRCDSRSE